MKKSIVIVVAFLILLSFIGTSVATWCDNDYNNRRNVNLNNTAGGALTSYQVYVDLTSTPINETSLRVYNGTSCGLRDHYCENNTGGNCYGVWIEYDAIVASTWNNNTAIYYTNSTVSSVSSGDNTFLSFCDFESQNVGDLPTGWTENAYGDFVITDDAKHGTRAGNLTYVSGSSSAVANYTIDTISTDNDREIIFWAKTSITSTIVGAYKISDDSGWTDDGPTFGFHDYDIEYFDGAWGNVLLATYSVDTWYKFNIYNIDISNNQYDIDINGVTEGVNIGMKGTVSLLNNLIIWAVDPFGDPSHILFIDTFLLRKNCSNDPITTLGDVENGWVDCTPPVISSLTNTTPNYNSVTITWSNNQSSDCIVKYSKQSDLTSPLWSSWDNDTASVSIGLSGLDESTPYYYQARAYNGTNSSCVVTEPVSSPYETFTTDSTPPVCSIPPNPTNLGNSKSTTWVNYTWSAGSGNVTDLYRVKLNGGWTNGSAATYKNTTGLSLGDWANITVYAYNTTCGNLSAGYVSDEQQTSYASVITNTETNISKSEVTFNGNLTNMDGQPNVTVYFEWGFNDACFAFKTTDQVLSSTGNFSQYVKSPFFYNGEIYKYRAVGLFDAGTEYGDSEQFTLNEISELVEKDFSESYDMIDTTNLSIDMFTDAIMFTFTNKLGNVFWAFILGMPFVMLWLRGDSTLIPSMLGFIGAGAIWGGFPPAFRSVAYVLLVISVAGFTYGIYKKKGGG